jgi:hypothetical protein
MLQSLSQLDSRSGILDWSAMTLPAWKSHLYRMGSHSFDEDNAPDDLSIASHRRNIEPWLSAVCQSEHLSLLLGSGFTTAVGAACRVWATGMGTQVFSCPWERELNAAATASANECGRGAPNIEDQIRAANQLLGGLELIGDSLGGESPAETGYEDFRQAAQVGAAKWRAALNKVLAGFVESILDTERGIRDSLPSDSEAHSLLASFLLSFASRAASRERLNIFTTNYDRLIEYGCDIAGLRIVDRFVGTLTPIFRSSRLEVDLHYSPPGIRGEPRYLEGVLRLTKLHGSIDWRWEHHSLRRYGIPFGSPKDHTDIGDDLIRATMIYPNPAKDVETLNYPYAELFRDFSAGICRPNSAVITYGYGFGDDHINRVLGDMLSIPSSHLVIISFDDASGRIPRFCEQVGRPSQISLMIGKHFGDIKQLVHNYLPKAAIDAISWRQSALLQRRGHEPLSTDPEAGKAQSGEESGT